MEDKQKVYIKGDPNRGAEVIKALTDLGGYNSSCLDGHNSNNYYFIDPDETIINTGASSLVFSFVKEFYKEIKLPRWKPKYNERYYSVSWLGRVMSDKWYGTCDDETGYQFGNVFKTRKEAELARDKIKKLLNQ